MRGKGQSHDQECVYSPYRCQSGSPSIVLRTSNKLCLIRMHPQVNKRFMCAFLALLRTDSRPVNCHSESRHPVYLDKRMLCSPASISSPSSLTRVKKKQQLYLWSRSKLAARLTHEWLSTRDLSCYYISATMSTSHFEKVKNRIVPLGDNVTCHWGASLPLSDSFHALDNGSSMHLLVQQKGAYQ